MTVSRRVRVTGGQVVDPPTGTVEPRELLVEDGRVVSTLSDGEVEEVDARGLFVLPGLIDCHVHLAMRGEDADPSAAARRSPVEILGSIREAAARTLRGGMTTVRDLGGWDYLEMQARDEPKEPMARMVLAGRLLSIPTPAVAYYPGMYEVVRGAEEVRAGVSKQLAHGADCIKVMATGAMLSPEDEDAQEAQLSEEEIRAAVDTAAAVGAHVAAHAHALSGIWAAVRAGVASIEHGTFADEAVLREMAARGTFLVPTIRASAGPLGDPAFAGTLPPHIRRRLSDAHEIHLEMLRLAHRVGTPIAMGTDAGAPGDLHGANAEECVALVDDVGLTPAESIRTATTNAARLLGREGEIGTLAEGAWADAVGYLVDPLADIQALREPALVIKAGATVPP